MAYKKGVAILFVLALLFVLVFFTGVVSAQQTDDSINLTDKQKARNSILNINSIMEDMNDSDFEVNRVNDSLQDAQSIYEAQEIREINRRSTDYSSIFEIEEEVKTIRENAFESKDEVYSLESRIGSLEDRGINVSEAETMLNNMKQEIQDERYEEALNLAPQIRTKISEIESQSSQANIVYQATKNSIATFFKENYLVIAIVLGALLALYLFFRKKVQRYFINRKIRNLQHEKETITALVKKSQRDYFEKGVIPEDTFRVRSKKYGEMIRDLDRKIPILKEKLAKLGEKGNLKGKE